MSACMAPPNRPDPFRSEIHPIRDLGSSTVKIQINHPTTHPRHVVVQLTQEEDDAITSLLKLHHHDPLQTAETVTALDLDSSNAAEMRECNTDSSSVCCHPASTSAEKPDELSCSDMEHLRETSLGSLSQKERSWSDAELEAGDTLLNLC